MLWVVEYSLYQGLESRVPRPQVINILLVYSLSAMVRIWVINTLRAVDRGAGSAARSIAVTLCDSRKPEKSVVLKQ